MSSNARPRHWRTTVRTILRGLTWLHISDRGAEVRLAGEFGGTPALDWFRELDGKPLHRDVRAALLRALWNHLERPEAWIILDTAGGAEDPGLVAGLVRIPADRLSATARSRLVGLLLRLLNHRDPPLRVSVLDRLAGQPVPDPTRMLLGVALSKLEAPIPDERAAAIRAALALATDMDAERFATAFTALLPDRRKLAESVIEFSGRTRILGNRLLEVRSAVLRVVESGDRPEESRGGSPPIPTSTW